MKWYTHCNAESLQSFLVVYQEKHPAVGKCICSFWEIWDQNLVVKSIDRALCSNRVWWQNEAASQVLGRNSVLQKWVPWTPNSENATGGTTSIPLGTLFYSISLIYEKQNLTKTYLDIIMQIPTVLLSEFRNNNCSDLLNFDQSNAPGHVFFQSQLKSNWFWNT